MWNTELTKILLQVIEECIDILRNRPDKFKAWKAITDAVNAHVSSLVILGAFNDIVSYLITSYLHQEHITS